MTYLVIEWASLTASRPASSRWLSPAAIRKAIRAIIVGCLATPILYPGLIMPILTIVEDYVMAAMRHAELEDLELGGVGAYVPECPGVLAFGDDVHECAAGLYSRLEEWVRLCLRRGQTLPVID